MPTRFNGDIIKIIFKITMAATPSLSGFLPWSAAAFQLVRVKIFSAEHLLHTQQNVQLSITY